MSKKETRFFKIENIRAESDGKNQISGYAAIFNSLSEDLGGFREKIAPGAFAKSLMGTDICAFWSHDPSMVLGRTSAGTCRLMEDDLGLAFTIEMPDTQVGRDAMVSIKRGDVTGMSFGFDVPMDTWDRSSDGVVVRTLMEVNLYEISPTAIPAYPATSVSARALEILKKNQEEWAWEDHQKTGTLVSDRRSKFEAKLKRRKLLELQAFSVTDYSSN